MIFTGQHHIMNQLRFILPDLYRNPNKGANFLLRGPSGYGKTTLAISMCRYLSGSGRNSFEVYNYDTKPFRLEERVVFIDEVHKMKDFEEFYPLMDLAFQWHSLEKAHVFIFATNADGSLPEAFSNRCTEFIFDDYSTEDLLLIARTSSGFSAPDEAFLEIIKAGNRNPREIKGLVSRISTYFSENPTINPEEVDYVQLLLEVFKIENGMDTLSRRYLEVLDKVGGTSSLSLLKSILHVDETTLTQKVEPNLITNGKILITRKGRTLV